VSCRHKLSDAVRRVECHLEWHSHGRFANLTVDQPFRKLRVPSLPAERYASAEPLARPTRVTPRSTRRRGHGRQLLEVCLLQRARAPVTMVASAL